MDLLDNPYRYTGLKITGDKMGRLPKQGDSVMKLLRTCPVYKPSPLIELKQLPAELGLGSITVKDERKRMGLGSFKALGAAYVIAKTAYDEIGDKIFDPAKAKTALKGRIFVTASAGNHGLSLAAGARIFGAEAVIYLAETVPVSFAERLKTYDAKIRVAGKDYEASLVAAREAAKENGWRLLSDSTWEGYSGGLDVMEGYLAMGEEILDAWSGDPATHLFLQAGVGGLAGAMARFFRAAWGEFPKIIVVEPSEAPALYESIRLAAPVKTSGSVSSMGRLDCKEPSLAALEILAETTDAFMLLSDAEVETQIHLLEAEDMATSPSGGAGFAGLAEAARIRKLGLGPQSRALVFLSEGKQ